MYLHAAVRRWAGSAQEGADSTLIAAANSVADAVAARFPDVRLRELDKETARAVLRVFPADERHAVAKILDQSLHHAQKDQTAGAVTPNLPLEVARESQAAKNTRKRATPSLPPSPPRQPAHKQIIAPKQPAPRALPKRAAIGVLVAISAVIVALSAYNRERSDEDRRSEAYRTAAANATVSDSLPTSGVSAQLQRTPSATDQESIDRAAYILVVRLADPLFEGAADEHLIDLGESICEIWRGANGNAFAAILAYQGVATQSIDAETAAEIFGAATTTFCPEFVPALEAL